jgi:hypothetical protein
MSLDTYCVSHNLQKNFVSIINIVLLVLNDKPETPEIMKST